MLEFVVFLSFSKSSLLVVALATGVAVPVQAAVDVYSSRKEALIKPLLDQFTQATGVAVNLVTGKDDALLKRLQVEGDASAADVLITADAARLHRAKTGGLIQAVDSEILRNAVPSQWRDGDNQWFGLTSRARPIIYAKDRVDPANLSTYEALADAQWQGRICVRSSSNVYNQSLVASMLAASSMGDVQQWASGLVNNFARKPAGGDTDQLRAVAAGQCDVALANTYYLGRLGRSDKAENQAVASALAVFWPNQEGRGAHFNISGIAMTKSADSQAEAKQLMEFMVSAEAQNWYAQANNEYPVVAGVAMADVLASFGTAKADTVAMEKLGELNQKALMVMDLAGWR
jgi:iron(III) transport system substrate-binding protein